MTVCPAYLKACREFPLLTSRFAVLQSRGFIKRRELGEKMFKNLGVCF